MRCKELEVRSNELLAEGRREPTIKFSDSVRIIGALTGAVGIPLERGQAEMEVAEKLVDENKWLPSKEHQERVAKARLSPVARRKTMAHSWVHNWAPPAMVIAVLAYFGDRTLNKLEEEDKKFDAKITEINKSINEIDKKLAPLSRIDKFLSYSHHSEEWKKISSVEKLQELDRQEFATIKGMITLTTGDNARPFETLPREIKKQIEEIKDKHDVTNQDLDNYREIGVQNLVAVWNANSPNSKGSSL